MRQLYSILTYASQPVLTIAGLFNPKLKAFVNGRKNLLTRLASQINPEDRYIWIHCASLGEYEQGLPIINALRTAYPQYKIALSFFSPSGFEIRKDNANADLITYLPLDTPKNANTFVGLLNPKLAIFVKYEFWPNYFKALKDQQVITLVVSGLFRANQGMFKSYGGWLKKSLSSVHHFFVQNEASNRLLRAHGFKNVTVSGDTRFDRVAKQIEQDNTLDFMQVFAQQALCVVCGSTWPEDDLILLEYIKTKASSEVKFVIAPHNINSKEIENTAQKLGKIAAIYSKTSIQELEKAKVLIVDTVGHLSRIYSYAQIAYVGGAMGHGGLHNILEPATFGVPILIGKHYSKFPEAIKLRELAGLYSVATPQELARELDKLIADAQHRSKTGMICGHFINSNTGATQTVMDTIAKLYGDRLV